MFLRSRSTRALSLCLAIAFAHQAGIVADLSPANAQIVLDDDDANNDDNNNNTGGAAGVVIDAAGVLHRQVINDPTGRLNRARLLAARGRFQGDLANVSKLRMVSLNRLEKAIKQAINDKKPRLSQEMGYLAGLTRVQYVFFLPETNDVVIAGPAEPWFRAIDGTVLGVESLRPVLHLEDLVVAMRAFAPGELDQNKVIGCSIDPTQQGLQNMQNYLRQIGNRPPPVPVLVNGLQQSLGLQNVTVQGIAPNTRFAQILIAADYRMKLIGIGLEQTPVKITSYIEAAAGGGKNALVRWYFVPDYECVKLSDDALAMELVGQGVKLIGADELVQADGTRLAAGAGDRASQKFVQSFTRMYSQLAARVPVYADLRNLIDLSIVAAYLQSNGIYEKAGWQAELLTDEQQFHVQGGNVPRQVETAVNAVFKGNKLLTPIGGGVEIAPTRALNSQYVQADEQGELHKRRTAVQADQLKANQWWWDAEAR